jgi:hypothetical protein
MYVEAFPLRVLSDMLEALGAIHTNGGRYFFQTAQGCARVSTTSRTSPW